MRAYCGRRGLRSVYTTLLARRLWFAKALLIAGAFFCSASSKAEEQPSITLPLVVHMARAGGEPVAGREFLAQQLARANEIFAPYGVRFVLDAVMRAPGPARMETREDRSALGEHVRAGVINCFVVAALRDVDEPSRMRRGVHWWSRRYAGKHYVILSAISEPDVLAHELGHYLGNPRHSDTPGNLMSYTRTDALPFLDIRQQQRMRAAVSEYLRTGELRGPRASGRKRAQHTP